MAEFKFFCVNKEGDKSDYYYNNENSRLLDDSRNEVPIDNKGLSPTVYEYNVFDETECRKIGRLNKSFKIQLGNNCNYKCSYCLQSVDNEREEVSDFSVGEFVDAIPLSSSPIRRFEFWGGEPLLYWNILYPLAKAIREKFPGSSFYMPTNGSLLTYDIVDQIVELSFGVSVSHDGPGQWQRGGDPLADPEQREIIQYLFNNQNNKGLFSFNPVLTKYNQSRKKINDWFLEEIGHDYFYLGEGRLIHPTDKCHKKFCIQSSQEQQSYSLNFLKEIRNNLAPNLRLVGVCFNSLYESFLTKRPWNMIKLGCGIDRQDQIDVDLSGRIIGCHNFSFDYQGHSRCSNWFGSLYDLDNVVLKLDKHWFDFEECRNCPVIHICGGGCPMTPDKLRNEACNNNYADNIPFISATIENITGFTPYYIEGPVPENRHDIFGVAKSENYSSLFDE